MKIDDPRDLGLWERPVDFEDDEPIGDYFMVTDTEMLGASLLMRYAYDFKGFNASNIYAVKSDDGKTWVDIPYTLRPDGRLQILAPNMAPLIRLEYRSAATMLKSNIIDTGKDPAPVPVGTL